MLYLHGEWDQNENKLLPMKENQCIPNNSGRNLIDIESQENVFNWIHERWTNMFRFSGKSYSSRIESKLSTMRNVETTRSLKDGFIFSNGCLVKVKHWINVSLRSSNKIRKWKKKRSKWSVNEKVSVNGCLTAKGDGAKIKPFVVF